MNNQNRRQRNNEKNGNQDNGIMSRTGQNLGRVVDIITPENESNRQQSGCNNNR